MKTLCQVGEGEDCASLAGRNGDVGVSGPVRKLNSPMGGRSCVVLHAERVHSSFEDNVFHASI